MSDDSRAALTRTLVRLVLFAAVLTAPVFLFGDYPWNRPHAGEPPLDARKVTRVTNWRAVAQLVTPEVCI